MENENKHFVGEVAQKAIIEKDGKVLVCRGVGDTLWEFPGGRLHVAEEPEVGLLREIREELGITVRIVRPINVCRSLHVKGNTWRVFISYHCVIVDDSQQQLDTTELEEYRWVSREEFKALPLFDDCRAAADAYLSTVA